MSDGVFVGVERVVSAGWWAWNWWMVTNLRFNLSTCKCQFNWIVILVE